MCIVYRTEVHVLTNHPRQWLIKLCSCKEDQSFQYLENGIAPMSDKTETVAMLSPPEAKTAPKTKTTNGKDAPLTHFMLMDVVASLATTSFAYDLAGQAVTAGECCFCCHFRLPTCCLQV
jgi:hypothetical protein